MTKIEKRKSYSESFYSEEWLANLYLEQYKIYPYFYSLKRMSLQIKVINTLIQKGSSIYTSYTKHYGDTNCISTYEVYKLNDVFISINKDVYLNKDDSDKIYGVFFLYQNKDAEYIKELCDELLKFKIRVKSKPNISIIIKDADGLSLSNYYIKNLKLDIASNYNDDFKDIDILIRQKLSKSNKGIVLLHGLPGTGKTSYIRYLTSKIKKKIIFIPTYMSEMLASPDFLSFMLDYGKNSILLIEDGENVIKSRISGGNMAVSNLLNISDGILGDILNCQIIITFNCDLRDIDDALYRKGRIIAKYEFSKLKKEKAVELAKKINIEADITNDMLLTDIYNIGEKSFKDERKKIGF